MGYVLLLVCSLFATMVGMSMVYGEVHNLKKDSKAFKVFIRSVECFLISFGGAMAVVAMLGGLYKIAGTIAKSGGHEAQCRSIKDTVYSSKADKCYKDGKDLELW